ncbi:MAG TPA: ATP-dependent helicase, partial [Candidatus Omnitrophica bacterium]|nr:ATP-dependent helicase [Candidatus Omnitrophota bacterium]
LAWWGILELTKGIGQKTVNFLYDLARANNKLFGEIILQEMENGFENLSRDKKLVQSTVEKVFDIVNQVEIPKSENQWGRWVNKQIKNEKLPVPEEGFSEILEKVDEEKSGNDMDLSQYINQIEPGIKDVMNAKVENRLRIMTLSRSKGLTVRAVIIAGVENGIIPHPKARDYQEERRLLYVGMTWAKEYLFLTRCRRRTGPTARSGRKNVAGRRHGCPFLCGGPVNETDGESELKILGV